MHVAELEFDWADPRRVGADEVTAAGPPDPARFPPISERRIAELVMRAALNGGPLKASSRRIREPHTYLVGMDGSALVKIGSATDPKKRLQSLQTGQPAALTLLWHTVGDFEYALHRVFETQRVRGEWFDLTPLGDAVDVVQRAIAELEAS